MTYGWPDAYKKARAADRILRTRLERLGLKFDAIHSEFVGANACHGEALSGDPSPDLAEVTLRVGVRGQDAAAIERFTRELAPLALNGPPVVTYPSGGKPKVEEIVAYWPALIPKNESRGASHDSGGVRNVARVKLREIAHARSGDKGDGANIGLIALQAGILSDARRRR